MSVLLIVTLAGLGALGGFSAGLLGFGGGVLMFPLLYYVPPLVGVALLDAKTVAAIVISQVFFSTLVGGLAHLRSGRVQGRIAVNAGIVSAIGSLAGSIASKWASEGFLLVLFGIVTVTVICIMLLPAPHGGEEDTAVDNVIIPRIPLSIYSFLTGVVIGFLGAGNFIFVPILIYILRVPTRIAIGSSLFIAMMNTASGFLGKLVTGQIPLLAAALVVAGATMGALAGERVHRRLSSLMLRQIYAAMVTLIAVRVWLTILGFDS
jgi:uncharacterized membrane protein YfcA